MVQCWSSIKNKSVPKISTPINHFADSVVLISRGWSVGAEGTEVTVGLDLKKAPQGSRKDLSMHFKHGRTCVGRLKCVVILGGGHNLNKGPEADMSQV